MARYIKKFTRLGALGPTEERGFAVWVGYDIAGVDTDLSPHGYINVDSWSAEEIAKYDVVTFKSTTAEELGIERKS